MCACDASHPFNPVCLPLGYSGNPGVNGVSHRGGRLSGDGERGLSSYSAHRSGEERWAGERASERFPPVIFAVYPWIATVIQG